MIRRMILLGLGLSLLAGCGQRAHPTVRQTSRGPENEGAVTTASNPSQDADTACPGSAVAHNPRPTHDMTALRKLAAEKRAKRPAIHSPPVAAANPAKAGDTDLAKITDLPAAKTGGAIRAKAARRHTAAGAGSEADRGEVQIGPMCLVAPKTWTRERPPIDLILAQFSLPRANGDPADATLTVAAAGENNSQSLRNLRKFQSRKPGQGGVEQLRIAEKEVVLLDNSTDAGDGSEGRYRTLNAMVFAGGKVYFVNCSGPERTVGERAGEFRNFLQTMKAID